MAENEQVRGRVKMQHEPSTDPPRMLVALGKEDGEEIWMTWILVKRAKDLHCRSKVFLSRTGTDSGTLGDVDKDTLAPLFSTTRLSKLSAEAGVIWRMMNGEPKEPPKKASGKKRTSMAPRDGRETKRPKTSKQAVHSNDDDKEDFFTVPLETSDEDQKNSDDQAFRSGKYIRLDDATYKRISIQLQASYRTVTAPSIKLLQSLQRVATPANVDPFELPAWLSWETNADRLPKPKKALIIPKPKEATEEAKETLRVWMKGLDKKWFARPSLMPTLSKEEKAQDANLIANGLYLSGFGKGK
ncbi:hypothetical protein CC80DRAFT_589286 [Byssothecium circinans]|uniref:Uncharacterized protein n=1 Tax=Byssothecium circinans TaxID=147558 RepID=A0A6A5U9E0_9PLEO|nr:hypothetical protein CC80DRAFT_589286 [Byssothecium circinans]